MKLFAMSTLVAGLSAFGTQAQDAYDLVYDYTDGSLTIVTTGNIVSYALETSQQPGPIITENFVPFVSIQEVAPGFFFKTGPTDVKSTLISDFMNLNSAQDGYVITPGAYNVGEVLPPNLSESEFFNLFDRHAFYVVELGTGLQPFDMFYVPEPTSLAMLSAVGLTLVRRRRR